jgi:hypothetical protein
MYHDEYVIYSMNNPIQVLKIQGTSFDEILLTRAPFCLVMFALKKMQNITLP